MYVRSCHDSGKTFTCSRIVAWFLMSFPGDSVVVTTAPTWNQVENQLWREVRAGTERAVVQLGGRVMSVKWDIGPKWYAIGISTDEAQNLQGFHATNILIIVDEADGIPDELWDAIDGLTTSGNAKVLAIGNPLNPASRFKKLSDAARGPASKAIRISAWDVLPYSQKYPFLLQQKWVDDKREKWGVGSALWQGKIEAEWPDQGTNVLIPMSWLLRSKGRMVPRLERIMGVDVARSGTNRTVRTLMEGAYTVFSRATQQENTMQTAGRVLADILAYGPVRVNVDETGVGGGVIDRLRQLTKIPVVGVNNGERPVDVEHFGNLGSELWWKARRAFELDVPGFAMDDPDSIDDLINDLNRPTWETNAKGQIVVDKYGMARNKSQRSLSDEQLSERSPDCADSWVLAYSGAIPYIRANTPEGQQSKRTFIKRRSTN